MNTALKTARGNAKKKEKLEVFPPDGLTIEDLNFGRALGTVFRLMREYQIPKEPEGGDSKEQLDLTSRLFLLALALAASHPNHQEKKKRGVKPKWGEFQMAALFSDVAQLQKQAKMSGKTLDDKAASEALVKLQRWKSFLKGVENPTESLRQKYSRAKADASLENFKLFFRQYEKQGEVERLGCVKYWLGSRQEKFVLRQLPMNIDQLLHRTAKY